MCKSSARRLRFRPHFFHPAIRDTSFRAITRSANTSTLGDLTDAIRAAFVAVEDAVRQAGGYKAKDFGAPLMKAAFHPDTGPMGDRDTNKPQAESEGLQTLFVGAMNAYRNPVRLARCASSLDEGKDQLLLASHLLRIVDARRPPPVIRGREVRESQSNHVAKMPALRPRTKPFALLTA